MNLYFTDESRDTRKSLTLLITVKAMTKLNLGHRNKFEIEFQKVSRRSSRSLDNALADHVMSTGDNIKWDHFDILVTGKSDLQCKIKEILLISELKPSLNENVGSEKLFLYEFLLAVSTIGSINFLSLFVYLITSSSLYFCIFLNVCNSYNRSLLKLYMYVVASKRQVIQKIFIRPCVVYG